MKNAPPHQLKSAPGKVVKTESRININNKRAIVENLTDFYRGKTVVIVAHRLSTVRNADQIVVLEKGHIVEIGNHEELIAHRGAYFHLVKNQLELGS